MSNSDNSYESSMTRSHCTTGLECNSIIFFICKDFITNKENHINHWWGKSNSCSNIGECDWAHVVNLKIFLQDEL